MSGSPRSRRAYALLAAVATAVSACGGTSGSVQPATSVPLTGTTAVAAGPANPGPGRAVTFPGTEWPTIDPATAGFDASRLEEIAQHAEQGGSSCLVVVRDGKLVKEWYWNGTGPDSTQEVFSATKSYTSVLVGIAQADGKLSISDKASKYIPEWAGSQSAEVTVRNLLSNNSGRHWDPATDYVRMATQEPNKTAFAVSLPQDGPPGSIWAYNNSAIQTLSAVLRKATGQEAAAYAQERLLGPIGMTHSEMRKDPSGGTLTFMGLSSTCRDMARFGYLMLNKGNWDGHQIVPAAYVDEATGQPSQDLNAAYGYLWWLNRRGKLASPMQPTTGETGGDRPDSQMAPGAPEDMYWALGLGSQIISVDPGSRTIVVRIGPVNVPKDARAFTQQDTAEVVTKALR